MNNDENVIQKYYAPFLSSNNHEDVYSGSEYYSAKKSVVIKTLFWIYR